MNITQRESLRSLLLNFAIYRQELSLSLQIRMHLIREITFSLYDFRYVFGLQGYSRLLVWIFFMGCFQIGDERDRFVFPASYCK